MDKSIYLCVSYYHLLISILKNIKTKGKNDLVIYSDIFDSKLANDNKLITKLKESKIFNNIYIYDYSDEQSEINSSKLKYIKYYFFIKKCTKECTVDFKMYKNIYIYNDTTLFGKILNKKNVYYSLIEDGTDCFKNNKLFWNKKFSIKKLIKEKILNIYPLGMSKHVLEIEVNDKTGVNLPKKIKEVQKKQLFSELSIDEKKIIVKIFIGEFDLNNLSNYSILITQPLYDDGLLNSEEQQINMYKYIVQKYLCKTKVIIKTHPREKLKYSNYFPDAIIIDKPFPIEIFNFIEKSSFDIGITISSTSINILENISKKIYLGWEWLNEYKNGDKYE